jgi:hypothetical protein
MAELNLYDIDQITSDVRMQEIGFSHLFHDLVDHICCDVEYHMQQGMSFEEAYSMVKAKIGFRGLKKIQEDTLYVVDSKYRNMKKLMKISGVAGTVMLSFAAIFKILHWPMGAVLLTLGAFILSFLFLPSALVVLWKETKNQKKLILFIAAFISGVAFIIGMLFKIQHWPGAVYIITSGLLIGIVLFIPSLLFQLFADKAKKQKRPLYVAGALSIILYCTGFWFRLLHWPLASLFIVTGSLALICIVLPIFTRMQWKEEKYVNARFIFMIVAPLLFILPGALVNLNLESNYEGGFYLRMEKQEALIDIQKAANLKILALFKDSTEFQKMQTIHVATEKLLGTVNLIQHNMVAISEGPKGTTDQSLLALTGVKTNTPINYGELKNPFDILPSALMLSPGCQSRKILDNEISGYRKILADLMGDEWTRENDHLLNISTYLPDAVPDNTVHTLVPDLNELSILASGILITEAVAQKQLSSK